MRYLCSALQVKEVSENPLAMAKVSQLTGKEAGKHKQEKPLETQVLESSIHKICSLLSVRVVAAVAGVVAAQEKGKCTANGNSSSSGSLCPNEHLPEECPLASILLLPQLASPCHRHSRKPQPACMPC